MSGPERPWKQYQQHYYSVWLWYKLSTRLYHKSEPIRTTKPKQNQVGLTAFEGLCLLETGCGWDMSHATSLDQIQPGAFVEKYFAVSISTVSITWRKNVQLGWDKILMDPFQARYKCFDLWWPSAGTITLSVVLHSKLLKSRTLLFKIQFTLYSLWI